MRHVSIYTPWGPSESANMIAPGITFHSTASHGGIHLSDERLSAMPAALRAIRTFCGHPNWYEEDCDFYIVVLAFPMEFTTALVHEAVSFTYDSTYWRHAKVCREWLETEEGALTGARAGRHEAADYSDSM